MGRHVRCWPVARNITELDSGSTDKSKLVYGGKSNHRRVIILALLSSHHASLHAPTPFGLCLRGVEKRLSSVYPEGKEALLDYIH